MTDDDLRAKLLSQREVDANGCWCWTGAWEVGRNDYGIVCVGGKTERVHRTAARLWLGMKPGQIVAHRPGCPPCCFAPAHLRVFDTRAEMTRIVGNIPAGRKGFANVRALLTPYALELIVDAILEGTESSREVAERVREVTGCQVSRVTVQKGIESRLAAGRRRRTG